MKTFNLIVMAFFTLCTVMLLLTSIVLCIQQPNKADVFGFVTAIALISLSIQLTVLFKFKLS